MYRQQAVIPQTAHEPGAREGARPIGRSMSAQARWMELQRGIGNQAGARLLQQQPATHAAARLQEQPAEKGPRRPKLEIGALNDPLEQEADRAAVAMTSGSTDSVSGAPHATGSRTRAAPAKEHKLPEQAAEAPAIVDDVLHSPGEPLDRTTRAHFEARFGRDFSHVRVHADGRAAGSAQAVGARAYTVGHDIVFDEREYDRHGEQGTESGGKNRHAGAEASGMVDRAPAKNLLAHELAHVAQGEASGGEAILRRQPKPGSEADRPVRGRVRQYDIAGREGGPDWESQFAPQKPPVDPTHVSSIKEAQDWVTDLGGFTRDAARRIQSRRASEIDDRTRTARGLATIGRGARPV